MLYLVPFFLSRLLLLLSSFFLSLRFNFAEKDCCCDRTAAYCSTIEVDVTHLCDFEPLKVTWQSSAFICFCYQNRVFFFLSSFIIIRFGMNFSVQKIRFISSSEWLFFMAFTEINCNILQTATLPLTISSLWCAHWGAQEHTSERFIIISTYNHTDTQIKSIDFEKYLLI